MAWTTPRTWTPGELVTALMMNLHVRDNLNYLFSAITDVVASITGIITDGVFTRPELTNYRETKSIATITAGALALDLANGNHFAVSLNANITSITFSNVPASGKAWVATVAFTTDGTLRTVAWPAATKWPGGTAPTMTSTNGKVDIVTFYSVDGGATIFATIAQNF